jgi:hypothetical protein
MSEFYQSNSLADTESHMSGIMDWDFGNTSFDHICEIMFYERCCLPCALTLSGEDLRNYGQPYEMRCICPRVISS